MFWTVGVGREKRERKTLVVGLACLLWGNDGSSSPWPLTCHQGSNEACFFRTAVYSVHSVQFNKKLE